MFQHTTSLVRLILITGLAASAIAAPCVLAQHQNIDKVSGSAIIGSGERYGDVTLVNGSVKLAADSSADDVTTVNGSITAQQGVSVYNISTVNGSIKAEDRFTVRGSASTVNGSVVAGKGSVFAKGVGTVNGDIRLSDTSVAENIETVNGDIVLDGSSHIQGDIIYRQRGKSNGMFKFFGWGRNAKESDWPVLRIAADVKLDGNIVLHQPVKLELADAALQQKVINHFNDGR